MVRNNELKPVGAISKQIARKIREISEAKGLSQEDLGRASGAQDWSDEKRARA